jgi:HEPN domain-containing protein
MEEAFWPALLWPWLWRLRQPVSSLRILARGRPSASVYTHVMADRSIDWFNQAIRDLEQAKDSRDAGRHEWACFAAHQSAEKAVKALHLHRGQEAWGHVVAQLLRELPVEAVPPEGLIERSKVLDNFYISTRYPNAHPDGAPYEHYGSLQSDQALEHASAILDFVRSQMA